MSDDESMSGMADPSSPAVAVGFQLSSEEVARALRWELLSRRSLHVTLASGVAVAALGAVFVATDPAEGGAGSFGLGAGLTLVALCLYLVWRVPRKAWRRNQSLQRLQTFSFSDAGVASRTPISEGRAQWQLYLACYENDEAYLLRLASRRAYNIIPKRAFDSSEDEQRFRHLVESHTESHLRGPNSV